MRDLALFHVFGIPLRVRPSWFAVALVLTLSLAFGYFPRVVDGLAPSIHALMGALATILLFATVCLHELGHALEARRQGIEVRAISLFALGGVAEIASEPRSARGELAMAAAGPLVSVVIALACFLALRLDAGAAVLSPALAAVVEYLALVNLGIAIFNMLPAYPLDGGRLLRAAIWGATGDYARATRAATSIGRWLALLLGAAGGVAIVLVDAIGGAWLVAVALFVYQAASAYGREVAVELGAGEEAAPLAPPEPAA